jgi:hypothetical protein
LDNCCQRSIDISIIVAFPPCNVISIL